MTRKTTNVTAVKSQTSNVVADPYSRRPDAEHPLIAGNVDQASIFSLGRIPIAELVFAIFHNLLSQNGGCGVVRSFGAPHFR